jgi:hypothetical protein
MKNWRTTAVGVFEAAMLSVGAEQLLQLTWGQRGIVYAVAFLRALASVLAADAKAVQQPAAVDPDKTPPAGTELPK